MSRRIIRQWNNWRDDNPNVRINLYNADLSNRNLSNVNLCDADLRYAFLSRTNLNGAILFKADLYGAILRDADLCDTDLLCTNLRLANLRGTCLDSNNKTVHNHADWPECHGYYVYGYRAKAAGHLHDGYKVGRVYSADIFSTADTECHPGLYLWPTMEHAKAWNCKGPWVKVRTPLEHTHRAGEKWRCRWFEVIEEILE